jgi:hypothetical protein
MGPGGPPHAPPRCLRMRRRWRGRCLRRGRYLRQICTRLLQVRHVGADRLVRHPRRRPRQHEPRQHVRLERRHRLRPIRDTRPQNLLNNAIPGRPDQVSGLEGHCLSVTPSRLQPGRAQDLEDLPCLCQVV